MRKIILSQMVTLDGLFGGPNGELDWHTFDDEFAAYANAQNAATDTMLFGRKTYEFMASYWTTPEALRDDPETTRQMNSGAKVVFSKTLDKADWENTRLVKTDLVEEVKRLKAQSGKAMVIFGSGQIVSALTPHRLIDEYHMFVCPWILGRGQVLFTGVDQPVKLTLLESKQFKSGLMLLNYAPA
jgi:dihydrofolate reductase